METSGKVHTPGNEYPHVLNRRLGDLYSLSGSGGEYPISHRGSNSGVQSVTTHFLVELSWSSLWTQRRCNDSKKKKTAYREASYWAKQECCTKKTKLRGLSPQANYTDRATAACR
jgi:hypothetical protein